jgi:type II secretory pathway predicted ATPase ExeA
MYESWFQFSKRPFGAAPQVADYYPSQTMETARKALVRCIECSAGPSIIVGGTGCGKTTLCLKLQEQYHETVPTAYVSCCGIRTRRELLQNVLFAFDRPYEAADEGELRISLTNFVRACEQSGVILIVDDVDDLPVEAFEELRSLSNLTSNGVWCINIVMAGKNKLEELLARPSMESLEQRIASRNYLATWSGRETTEYVQFQISRAGGDGQAMFSTEAMEQIHATSDGVPRLVNQLCDHALIMAALGNVKQLDGSHVAEAWADLQQLPAPSRQSKVADEGSSMIEFGTLDEDDTNGSETPCPSETAATADSHSSQDGTPCGEACRPADAEFGELDADHETPAEGFAPPPEEASELHASHKSGHDLVDRLDDIEREVQRVSTELHGETADPPSSDVETACSGNPFLELFDEEELIFSTHSTMHNELVHRQPTVFTPGGESLINVIRMVDQGMDSHDEWERLEDICSSPPADDKLSLELTSVPFSAVREEPEIAASNCDGADFSDGEFTFNYAAPNNAETDAHEVQPDSYVTVESYVIPELDEADRDADDAIVAASNADDLAQDDASVEQFDRVDDFHVEDQAEANSTATDERDTQDACLQGPFDQLGVEFVPERNFEAAPQSIGDVGPSHEVDLRSTPSPLTIAPDSAPGSFVNNTNFGSDAEFLPEHPHPVRPQAAVEQPDVETQESATPAAPMDTVVNEPVAPPPERRKFNSLFSKLKSPGS